MKYLLLTMGLMMNGRSRGYETSAIGVVLKRCGLRITFIKIDPYLNTDVGTMSPVKHGEVFVLDDGGEVDLDLGNYEKYFNIKLTRDHHITAGKIYQSVIEKGRRGDYLGENVQVVPHITDAIQEWVERVAEIPVDGMEGPADVCVIGLGGKTENIESMPFLEALGQFSYRVGPSNFCLVHFSLVPVLNAFSEQKIELTQRSILDLRSCGLTPSILVCLALKALEKTLIEKLSKFCYIPENNIVTLSDAYHIMLLPSMLMDQKAHDVILKELNLPCNITECKLDEWARRANMHNTFDLSVRIAVVVKYSGLPDSYSSVTKALFDASIACRHKLVPLWVSSADLEEATFIESREAYDAAWSMLRSADGIIVPGGFGVRGVEGKIRATKYARENKVPFLGIGLGMQIAVIEYARSVLNLEDANSTEFDPETKNPCVIFMPEGSRTQMGGTMRLGSIRTYFQVATCISARLYRNVHVDERHRHRYEVNPEMVARLENAGMSFVGKDETGRRMEILELPSYSHPYFVGVQFHPEFKSSAARPSVLFLGLIAASRGKLREVLERPHQPHRVGVALFKSMIPKDMSTEACGSKSVLDEEGSKSMSEHERHESGLGCIDVHSYVLLPCLPESLNEMI